MAMFPVAVDFVAGRPNRSRVLAAASTNATNLKSKPGNLYGFYFENNAAYDVYVKFYDKASAPTVGTDVPVFTVKVPTGSNASPATMMLDGLGTAFANGISYAATKLFADTDTTVLVANDVQGFILWK